MGEAQAIEPTPKTKTKRGRKTPEAKPAERPTYVMLSADLAKLQARLERQRDDVLQTEEAVKLTKTALTAELARVK